MNVDLKIAQSIDIQNISVIHVARKDGYRIKGFLVMMIMISCMTIATQSLLFKRENEELPTDTLAQNNSCRAG